MVLFRGYIGTILHTGDFRFNPIMLQQLDLLYPVLNRNIENKGCSIHIDELVLDDTYCDSIFKFPKRVRGILFDNVIKNLD